MLVAEKEQSKHDRDSALTERVPPLKLSGLSAQELQVNTTYHTTASDVLDKAFFFSIMLQ